MMTDEVKRQPMCGVSLLKTSHPEPSWPQGVNGLSVYLGGLVCEGAARQFEW